ncbi:COG1607 Acyl-CoA hydrolase [uncultured Caudovirales phage]|uniref:COG1607 Acyl-CoA hydrolase n=1 Tax=uncultured Caudovirales phage TaxID=2100421 RepID=A0A6J5NPU1_9CAUD|nr:COG1607 Acyl-CoA hydrolase [uncultured Caudovirales phage]
MELLNTHPIKKSDLGFHGNLFGGKLLSWLDAAAVGYAMQLCDTPRMVTVSIDKCNFEKPAKEGQLLKIYGKPSEIGNTSTTLYIEARAHNVRTGKQIIVLKTHIKFVHIDEEGNPIPIGEKGKRRIQAIIGDEPSNEGFKV